MQYEKEKEELTNLSEELNLKIRKTEREVLALENTLKLVTSRNHSFRQGIIQADRNCNFAFNLKWSEMFTKLSYVKFVGPFQLAYNLVTSTFQLLFRSRVPRKT